MITIQELQKLDKELRENRSKRILICFCVDSSASMARSGAIERVRVGLDRFFDKISKDTLAHDAANVCVILFSDEPELVCDYGPLESTMAQLRAHPIRAVGAQTMLSAGVNMALDRLTHCQQELAAVNNNTYVPWLILISDGDSSEPPEVVNAAAAKVQAMLRAGRLKTKCMDVGDGSRNLRPFTLDGHVDKISNMDVMLDFFEMLSRSVSATSKAVMENGGPDIGGKY